LYHSALPRKTWAGANQIPDRYFVALARQHGFSLATLDQPLARSFADETGLVELLH
jgi:predicted nucleic acid-binding protein